MNLSKRKFIIYSIFLVLLSCQLSNPKVDPEEDYFRIYNVNSELAYEANDVFVLGDGSGYIIYGTAIVDSSGGNSLIYNIPYLMKIDQFGIVEWDTAFIAYRDDRDKSKRVDNSRKRFAEVDGKYLFTGYPQDQGDNLIRLLEFEEETLTLREKYVFEDATADIEAVDIFPNPNGGFYTSVSKCYNTVGVADRVGLLFFDVGANLQWEVEVTDSYMCKRFTSGSQEIAQPTALYNDVGYLETNAGDQYVYLKTAANESVEDREFNLVVVDANTGDSLFSNLYNDIRIVFDGENSDLQTDMPIILYTDGDDSLRIATVNFTTGGEEVLFPSIEVNTGETEVTYNENEFSSNEFRLGNPVVIEEMNFGDNNILIYGATTREGRIVIEAIDESSSKLLNKKYFGYNSYYEIGAVKQTVDEGLIIVGHTITSGRFQQLCVFKVSASRFSDLITK